MEQLHLLLMPFDRVSVGADDRFQDDLLKLKHLPYACGNVKKCSSVTGGECVELSVDDSDSGKVREDAHDLRVY